MSRDEEPRKGREPAKGRSAARKRVTLKQVAEALDLSPATVSLVLNRSPVADAIPQETHERVIATAKQLGYRPDFLARSLRSRRSYSIGVLLPEISEGHAAGVLSGIEARLLEEGYFYLVASHRSRPDLLKEYMQLLEDRLVEGFVLVNTRLDQAPGLPTVAVAGHEVLEDVTNVVIDHDRAADLALGHLAELGHRRIAFFKGHALTTDAADRWRGIRKTAAALDLELGPSRTVQLGQTGNGRVFSPEEGHQEGYYFGQELLRQGVEFTALFAFNDVSAIGAMRAFMDAGLRVPEDVSVIGFDDIQSAAFQNPGLTTVRQPLREMGETASRVLLEKLSGRRRNGGPVTIAPELVVRGSTAPAGDGGNRRRSSRRRRR